MSQDNAVCYLAELKYGGKALPFLGFSRKVTLSLRLDSCQQAAVHNDLQV